MPPLRGRPITSIEGAGTLDDPQTLILSYTLGNDKDASHDNWVCVDHVNHPPEARFEWAPDAPHEGDVIGLYGDRSVDPDGADDIVKWRWVISKGGETKEYNDTNNF
ncbi:MAG: hypothetical protein ACWGN7_07115, partial [Thermodesulfovibrionales bacterium]